MILWRRDEPATTRTARVRVRLHDSQSPARPASTAAGRDGDALLVMWIRARRDARRRS